MDANFLLNSGLIFEINRATLHPFGIGLGVVDNKIVLVDNRKSPDKMKFDTNTYEKCYKKLHKFMETFGNEQLEKKRDKIGYAFQSNRLK